MVSASLLLSARLLVPGLPAQLLQSLLRGRQDRTHDPLRPDYGPLRKEAVHDRRSGDRGVLRAFGLPVVGSEPAAADPDAAAVGEEEQVRGRD